MRFTYLARTPLKSLICTGACVIILFIMLTNEAPVSFTSSPILLNPCLQQKVMDARTFRSENKNVTKSATVRPWPKRSNNTDSNHVDLNSNVDEIMKLGRSETPYKLLSYRLRWSGWGNGCCLYTFFFYSHIWYLYDRSNGCFQKVWVTLRHKDFSADSNLYVWLDVIFEIDKIDFPRITHLTSLLK